MLNDRISTSGQKKGRPPLDEGRQLERAHRILDAAGVLILRWGYDKTTVDDVARAAQVAKGTIYLHWRTREELFTALLRRERVRMLDEVSRRVAATPGGLRDLLRLMTEELLGRPIMKASTLGDSAVLGKLTRSRQEPGTPGLDAYFAELLELGGLRADLTAAEHAHVVLAIYSGFLVMPRNLPDERLAELLADAAARAVEPAVPPGDARAIARATTNHLEYARDLAERMLQSSLGTKERVR